MYNAYDYVIHTFSYIDYCIDNIKLIEHLYISSINVIPFMFRIVLTVFLFMIRAFASGVFQAIYVYTPEVYPTSVRAFALGSCSAFARVGAIATPYIAQVHGNLSPFTFTYHGSSTG